MSILGATAHGDKPLAESKARARPGVLTLSIILINLELVFLTAWSIHEFGSISAGLAYLNGDRLLVDPYILSFGDLQAGDYRTVEVTLDNRADHSIEIRGASRPRSALSSTAFPLPSVRAGRQASPLPSSQRWLVQSSNTSCYLPTIRTNPSSGSL